MPNYCSFLQCKLISKKIKITKPIPLNSKPFKEGKHCRNCICHFFKGYCSFNAQLVLRCNKIDILIPLNLQMPVS